MSITYTESNLKNKVRTTVRISKLLYSYRFICFLKQRSDFNFKEANRQNYVFYYYGTVENAEFYFKLHLATWRNMQKRVNLKG